MDRTQADALIGELGGQLGIPELALDGDGIATLVLEGGGDGDGGDAGMVLSLGHSSRAGTLDLMVCLDGTVPAGAQLAEVLTANFAWQATDGACFALEPSSGALVLQRRCTAEDGPRLRDLAEGLVAAAEAWAGRLERAPADAEGPPAGAEEEPGGLARFAMGALRA